MVPIRADGSKAPALAWKGLQRRRPSRGQTGRWFTSGPFGVAVLCGAVSGGLEMFELEGRAIREGALDALAAHLRAIGALRVWARLTVGGYVERTPSGGLHVLYRVEGAPVGGNTRLAARPATGVELACNPTDRVKVLAETRGEGGYVVVAPSGGTTHASGLPWTALLGSVPARIPTVTANDRDTLITAARRLNQIPTRPPTARRRPIASRSTDATAPGTAFERVVDWAELLEPAGWRLIRSTGATRLWRRPGKTSGVSASTGHAPDRDRLFVFSTSSEFESGVPITKFHAYAVMNHGGDHRRAAAALRQAGFGAQTRFTRADDGSAGAADQRHDRGGE